MEFDLTLTRDEIAVIIGSILVAERTMPDPVVEVALGLMTKFDAALDLAGL